MIDGAHGEHPHHRAGVDEGRQARLEPRQRPGHRDQRGTRGDRDDRRHQMNPAARPRLGQHRRRPARHARRLLRRRWTAPVGPDLGATSVSRLNIASLSPPCLYGRIADRAVRAHSNLVRCGDHSAATQRSAVPALRVAAAPRPGRVEIRAAAPHRGAVRRQPALGARRRLRRRQLRLPDGRGQDRRDAALVPGSRHRNGHCLFAFHRKPAPRSGRAGRADRDHHRCRRGDLRAGQPLECAHGRGLGADRRGARTTTA